MLNEATVLAGLVHAAHVLQIRASTKGRLDVLGHTVFPDGQFNA